MCLRSTSYKSAAAVVPMLADIVSKNGNLMLSVPVRRDGTIDEDEVKIVERSRRLAQSQRRSHLRDPPMEDLRRRSVHHSRRRRPLWRTKGHAVETVHRGRHPLHAIQRRQNPLRHCARFSGGRKGLHQIVVNRLSPLAGQDQQRAPAWNTRQIGLHTRRSRITRNASRKAALQDRFRPQNSLLENVHAARGRRQRRIPRFGSRAARPPTGNYGSQTMIGNSMIQQAQTQIEEPSPAERPAAAPAPARLTSMDAYRGLVMFLMMAEVLRLSKVAQAVPESGFWKFLAYHQNHVRWVGCSLHDLIQPSFSFLVGVALPFSLSSRVARGQSRLRMTVHAFWRALLLVLLGIFLRSFGHQTNWTFEDTLAQIGLGYGLLFLLGQRPVRCQWIALGVILVGYWAAFALYPLPGPDFDYTKVGVPKDGPHIMAGFAAHWSKNSNLAWAFDTWFMNLFPRESPFCFPQRRLRNAQLYTHAGNDDPRLDCRWRPAQRTSALGESQMAGACRRGWTGPGLGARRIGNLSGSEEDLDPELDTLQWRLVFCLAGGVLRRM